MKYILANRRDGEYRIVISSDTHKEDRGFLNCFSGKTAELDKATKFNSIEEILLMCHRHGKAYPSAIHVFDGIQIICLEE